MTIGRNRLLAIGAMAALALGVTVAQMAPAAAARPATVVAIDVDGDEAVDEPGEGVTTCKGANQEMALVRMNNLPTALAETGGVFTPLPGASVTFNTPAADTDQVLVIFSAEARLMGQPLTYGVPTDFLQIRVLLDGVPMQPLNDLIFTTDVGESNAAQACGMVGGPNQAAMAHTVRVDWLIVDQGAAQALTGSLDDWVLHVEINN